MHDVIVNILSTVLIGVGGFILDSVRKQIKSMHLDIMRVRILTLIYDDPTSHAEILDLFAEYEKMGGNGSTKSRVEQWKSREGLD